MPEQMNATHTLDNKALIPVMLKHFGIHEGYWMLQVSFTFGAGNMGPSEADVQPTGFVGLSSVGLVKVPTMEPRGLVLDAAVANPLSAKATPARKRSAAA
jgi:hypothetical protein